jgi:preprotein translocase SecE subunit
MSKDTARTPKTGAAPALPSMKRGMKAFIQDLGREMKNVTWPTPQETTRLAGVVAALCAAIVIILFTLSFAFEQILKIISGGQG